MYMSSSSATCSLSRSIRKINSSTFETRLLITLYKSGSFFTLRMLPVIAEKIRIPTNSSIMAKSFSDSVFA